jgi:transcriptional repressor NrdR
MDDDRVIETRSARDGEAVRRRRECACGKRFTTFEAIETPRLFIVKRSGAREEFRRDKVLRGLVTACNKRPVPIELLERATDRIESSLLDLGRAEATSEEVGERCLRELRELDSVAYVRFASVYREFETLADFQAILNAFEAPAEAISNG